MTHHQGIDNDNQSIECAAMRAARKREATVHASAVSLVVFLIFAIAGLLANYWMIENFFYPDPSKLPEELDPLWGPGRDFAQRPGYQREKLECLYRVNMAWILFSAVPGTICYFYMRRRLIISLASREAN